MKIIICLTVIYVFPMVSMPAETHDTSAEGTTEEVDLKDIPLPQRDDPEYWVIRSDAVGEIIPLLTGKRAEIKQKRQQVADYLDRIGRTMNMAAQQIKVPDDPALYAEALGWSDSIRRRDIDLPKTLPNWEETVELAMRFIISEGYVPIQFDGVEDIQGFVDVCERKETYARKVRDDVRAYLNDYLEMWLYLKQSDEQFAYHDWVMQRELEAQRAEQAEREQWAEQRRAAAMQRKEQEKQLKFQLEQNREAFRSTRREREYYTREKLLFYRLSLLNAHYARYYYCW